MGTFAKQLVDAVIALHPFWFCGMVGVLVDFDHVIQMLWFKEMLIGRFLHTPIFIMCGIVLCCACAYIGRLGVQYLLTKVGR
jgi:hypothetical protein